MSAVFAIASNITTHLGLTTGAVWDAVIAGRTGIRPYADESLSPVPFYASMLDEHQWAELQVPGEDAYSPFEQLALYSIRGALAACTGHLDPARTVLILSSTKGNIEWLGQAADERSLLTTSARLLAGAVGLPTAPVVVSHACVSGVIALQYGMRLLQSGRYDHAVVVGADRFTRFVLNGFQSFQAVADGPCRPFDAARKGINLGEAAATIILSNRALHSHNIRLLAGATSNDANHISGPSRTGAELAQAITSALGQAGIRPGEVGMISAHGTATLYNDEMESRAFARAGLLDSDVHSLKGYVGHTLGAAGVLESALVLESMRRQLLIPSAGYSISGVPEPLRITTAAQPAKLDYVLKTASGFGGCNAVVVWGR